MTRIARQHSIYNDIIIVDKTSSSSGSPGGHFCVEPSNELFSQVLQIIQLINETKDTKLIGPVILSCLRIIKVNISNYLK